MPDYDEAIAQNLKQAPPPSYQVAMSSPINSPNAVPETTVNAVPSTTNENDVPSSPPPYNIVTDTITTPEGAAVAATAAATNTVATEINTGNNDSDDPQASNSANATINGNNPSAKVIWKE